MKNYLQNRERAIAWMNSSKHDFSQGVAILKDAGFKPGVVSVLERHGSGRNQSDERLKYHMSDFIRCFANEAAREDTDLSLGVVDGKVMPSEEKTLPKGLKIPSMFSDETEEKMTSGIYPEPIAKIISRYREAYIERDRLRLAMADLPETNEEDTVEKRRLISDKAKQLADEMDTLYPLYENYIVSGKLPADDDTSKKGKDSEAGTDTSGNKVELQKQRKSIATKILRARNMLLYQSETKQEKENPLTDEKKVAKYQAKIERLTQELKEIDLKLAALA